VAQSPRSHSNSTPPCCDPGEGGTVSAVSPRPYEKSETTPGRDESTGECPEPGQQLNLYRTVEALTQLAQHFKRLRDRTGSSPPPESRSSISET
jgi:hypothetical protein